MRKYLMSLGCIILVSIIAFVAWRTTTRPSDTPVEALPSSEYGVQNVSFFLQNDPRWANDTLGASSYKMAGSGCLVSCIASSLCAQGMDTDPGRLNDLFTESGVYNDEGEILWDKVSQAIPKISVTTPAIADNRSLEKAVSDGLMPIVKVKYKGSGYQHWVLLIGADENGYLCMDPLYSDKEPLSLSAHGDVIYRYRFISVQ